VEFALGHDLGMSMLHLYFISINQPIMKLRSQVEDLNQHLFKRVTVNKLLEILHIFFLMSRGLAYYD
jgi:hypothetical protein